MKLHITDAILNGLISKYQNHLNGGLADKANPQDFDRNQLIKGIQVEMEHTKNLQMALEIAMDHLKEYPDYYDRLDKAGL